MQLTLSEQRVFGLLELEADLSATEVARRARLKSPTVQRILALARERGFIAGRTAVIDLSQLGLLECGICLSLQGSEENHERLMKILLARREVSWIAELGGEYDLAFNLIIAHPREAQRFLAMLSEQFPGVLASYSVCFRTERIRFCRAKLFGHAGGLHSRARFYMGRGQASEIDERSRVGAKQQVTVQPVDALDAVDWKVLEVLSGAAHESFRELALIAEIPVATFLRRIKQLRQKKILLGFGLRFNLDLLGVQQYRILISSAEGQERMWKRLTQYCTEQGRIKLLTKVLGEWCIEAEVDVKSPHELKVLIRELKAFLRPEKAEIRTLPILQHRKFISFPPIRRGS
jgi:DNA-binding Lrp family transcriptional regulator